MVMLGVFAFRKKQDLWEQIAVCDERVAQLELCIQAEKKTELRKWQEEKKAFTAEISSLKKKIPRLRKSVASLERKVKHLRVLR